MKSNVPDRCPVCSHSIKMISIPTLSYSELECENATPIPRHWHAVFKHQGAGTINRVNEHLVTQTFIDENLNNLMIFYDYDYVIETSQVAAAQIGRSGENRLKLDKGLIEDFDPKKFKDFINRILEHSAFA